MTAKFVQHRSPQTNKAKAPYNFVPLPERVLPAEEFKAHDTYDPNRHTGYIELEITTETPLYTRCATPTEVWSKYQGDEYFEDGKPKATAVRECQDFFHHGNADIPVIPGSTLRGMTRSLVEILAYGKMNFVTDSRLVHRAVGDVTALGNNYRKLFLGEAQKVGSASLFEYPLHSLQGGYLVKKGGKYFIRPACRDEHGETFVHVEYVDFERLFPSGQEPREQFCYGEIDDKPIYVEPTQRIQRETSSNQNIRLNLAVTSNIQLGPQTGLKKAVVVVSGHMQGKSGRLSERDIRQGFSALVRDISLSSDSVPKFLRSTFSPRGKEKLNNPQSDKKDIINELNNTMAKSKFWQEPCFQGLDKKPKSNALQKLQSQLKDIRRKKLRDEIALRINRLYLELAFPNAFENFVVGTEKHMHCAIYEPDMQAEIIPIQKDGFASDVEDKWRIYFEDSEMTRGIPTRKLRINGADENTQIPLFYLLDKDNNLYFFGPTMMFRLPYPSTVLGFVPAILRCPNELDIPEVIFGKVDEKSKEQLAGRVFFSDAICKTEKPFLKTDEGDNGRRIPKILSSPKPTSFQLYLTQPQPNGRATLRSYHDFGETVIRGAKRYWHQRNVEESDYVADSQMVKAHPQGTGIQERKKRRNSGFDNWKESKQHTIIKPVKNGVKFEKGRVYFENLSRVELGALLTALELPAEKRHQIGMAKPYGLGTVKIEIKEFVLQDRSMRYQSLFDDQENGWSDDAKPSAETDKQEAVSAFQSTVLEHYNALVTTNHKASEFWQIPRLQALAAMLEWQNAGNFDEKQYANLENDKLMWRNRHVLPYPQTVANPQHEPKQIQLTNPNLWEEKCAAASATVVETKTTQSQQMVTPPKPTVSASLLNLPEKDVPAQMKQHYDAWNIIEDSDLKLATAQAIVAKCKSWKKAKTKPWYQEVFAFVERSK